MADIDYEDINWRVASKIGWADLHIREGELVGCPPKGLRPDGVATGDDIPIPDYSRDLVAAFQAVDYLATLGLILSVGPAYHGTSYEVRGRLRGMTGGASYFDHLADAQTIPLAICSGIGRAGKIFNFANVR